MSIPREADISDRESSSPERPSEGRPFAHALLEIEGMHCAACAGRVERALQAVAGVSRAHVNLVTAQASVRFDPGQVGPEQLADAVTRGGYAARVVDEGQDAGQRMLEREAREAALWRGRFLVALALLAPLVWLTHFAPGLSPGVGWWQLVLATPIQLYVGWPYWVGAWRRLRHGQVNMDSLVALGTGVAYGAGLVEFGHLIGVSAPSHPGPVMYFADAGMILTFITLGKYLEVKAKGRASLAIRRLLDLAPPEATVLGSSGPERVPVRAVLVGERVLVRPGEKVPLDGDVISGSSSVDQSWLTGEAIPVPKGPGDEILARTINGQGALTAVVTRPAGQTALARVIELVRRAQESKTELGRLADRIVAWFVPAVLVLAAVSGCWWGFGAGDWDRAVACAVAVLVAACPCAMGLATPAAVLVASGRGAECGILIRHAHALEAAGRLTDVVLDKTGTVTEGRPRVVAVEPEPGVTPEELLAWAGAAERLSQHPLGQAIVAEAEARSVEIPQAEALEAVVGQGVRARAGERVIAIGNERLIARAGIDAGGWAERFRRLRSRGQTPVGVLLDNHRLGLISVTDPVAAGSRPAIERLRSMGLQLHLVSGDHRRTVEAVAAEVGIDQVEAEVLPEQKQTVVNRLRQAGRVVAMVGDGINDAPALVAADVGVAIGSGADVAIESADIVLIEQDLGALVRAVLLSRASLRTIWQNLGWAFVYNLFLLPLAAGLGIPLWGISLPPAAAAAAMAASSVSVVSNSLLLRRRKLDPPAR